MPLESSRPKHSAQGLVGPKNLLREHSVASGVVAAVVAFSSEVVGLLAGSGGDATGCPDGSNDSI